MWCLRLRKANGQNAALAAVYVYITLKDALGWEYSHSPEQEDSSAMGEVQRDYVRTVQADAGRQVTYVDEDDAEVTVTNVSDSPASSGDVRGWDRPTSYGRSAKAKATAAPKAPAMAFRTVYRDAAGREFVLTRSGWSFNDQRVATAIRQRLERRLERGELQRIA